jgi:hypothetical protein
MNANTMFPLAAIALLAAGIAPSAVSAPDPEQTYGGIRYACTGVGEESRTDPRWPGYSVKLVFAAANGGFLGDVTVTIADSSGSEVFAARCLTPWMLVDLPPGTYQVEALARKSHTQSFALTAPASGQRERTTRFAEIAN